MTCGSSEPLVTVGDRCCPCGTVATRTQRGPSAKISRRCPLHLGVALGRCAVAWSLASGGCAVHDEDRECVLGTLR